MNHGAGHDYYTRSAYAQHGERYQYRPVITGVVPVVHGVTEYSQHPPRVLSGMSRVAGRLSILLSNIGISRILAVERAYLRPARADFDGF